MESATHILLYFPSYSSISITNDDALLDRLYVALLRGLPDSCLARILILLPSFSSNIISICYPPPSLIVCFRYQRNHALQKQLSLIAVSYEEALQRIHSLEELREDDERLIADLEAQLDGPFNDRSLSARRLGSFQEQGKRILCTFPVKSL